MNNIKEITGFIPLFIRDVPMGMPLTANNQHTFPTIFSHSYMSIDGDLMLSPTIPKGTWRLRPHSEECFYIWYGKFSFVEGDLDHCISKVKEYYDFKQKNKDE